MHILTHLCNGSLPSGMRCRPCFFSQGATGVAITPQLIVVNPRLYTSTFAGVAVTPKLIEVQPALIKVKPVGVNVSPTGELKRLRQQLLLLHVTCWVHM